MGEEQLEPTTEKKKRNRPRNPDTQLQAALNQAEQFANDGALADKRFIADKRLLAQRIKTLTILTARVRRDEMKQLKAELAAKDAEIERLKTAAPAPTDTTGELENLRARVLELSRANDALRRSAAAPDPRFTEQQKTYGYLIECVAAMANLDRDTRLRIFKHVVDVNGIPSWKTVEFEQLLGQPRRPSPPPEPLEVTASDKRPAPVEAQVAPAPPVAPRMSIAEIRAVGAKAHQQLEELRREGGLNDKRRID